jgi:hypothetical protein
MTSRPSTSPAAPEAANTPSAPPPQRSTVPASPSAPAPPLPRGWSGRLRSRTQLRWSALISRPLFPHQAAAVRIGFSLVFAAFLLREWPHRRVLYGDLSPWSNPMARQLLAGNHAFSVLVWSDQRWWFEFCYAAAFAVSLALLVGWRTRASSVLFMVAVTSLQNRSVFVGDGSDNVIHLMAIYLAFTRCGEVWSLDARRRRRQRRDPGARDRTGPVLWAVLGLLLLLAQATGFAKLDMLGFGTDGYGWGTVFWAFWLLCGARYAAVRYRPDGEARALLDNLANLLHACALLVIATEVCLIYATAGWYKIQGSLWQSGTAVYYPLHLDYFTPWPSLDHALAGQELPVFLISYGTVLVQVAFPFTVFTRRLKNVLLVLLVMEHIGIAVVLGIPLFSAAMIAADAVFLPTGFLLWAGDRLGRRFALTRRFRLKG